MSQAITSASAAISPNLVGDLSELSASLNRFLDLADGGRLDDPDELQQRYQTLKQVWCSVVGLYGPGLSA
ncbi:MAG TPA: hypothetical protein V6D19_05755 [Stenomitos sp.]